MTVPPAFGWMVDRAETLRQIYQTKSSRERKLTASSNVFVTCQVDNRVGASAAGCISTGGWDSCERSKEHNSHIILVWRSSFTKRLYLQSIPVSWEDFTFLTSSLSTPYISNISFFPCLLRFKNTKIAEKWQTLYIPILRRVLIGNTWQKSKWGARKPQEMLLYPKHSGNLSVLKAQDGVLLPEPDKRRLPNRSFHFCREGWRRGMNTQTPSLPSLPLFPAGWTQWEPEGWEVKQRDQPPGSSGWRRVKCGCRGRQGITPTPLHLEATSGNSLLFLLLILKKELNKIELGLLFVHLSIPFSLLIRDNFVNLVYAVCVYF